MPSFRALFAFLSSEAILCRNSVIFYGTNVFSRPRYAPRLAGSLPLVHVDSKNGPPEWLRKSDFFEVRGLVWHVCNHCFSRRCVNDCTRRSMTWLIKRDC